MNIKPTYEELVQRVKELEKEVSSAQKTYHDKTNQLEERIKELDCLYSISKFVEKPGNSLQEVLQGIANLIPHAWQYPEITCTRIIVENKEVRTDNFRETTWRQTVIIKTNSQNVDILEVLYLEQRPVRDEGPFLKEERKLLNAIAERLGHIIEHKRAEEAVKQREKELEIKTKNLEEVNTALKVLLKRREEDRVELEEKVLLNVRELIIPYLEKLENSGLDDRQRAFASIVESNLNDLTSSFSRRLSSLYLNLSPAEIQIADLVRQGKHTKKIAELLNSSTRAIEFHRDNIRRKLGLTNKKVNLRSHLLSLS